MSPFFLGPLIKGVERRRRLEPRSRPGRSLWWLIVLETTDTTRDLLRRPVGVFVLALLGTAVMLVGLSGLTPGPVLPIVDRALAAAVVVAAATIATRFAPRAAQATVWLAAAGLTAVIEIGLHPTTAGPVIEVPWRWVAAVLLATGAAVLGELLMRARNRTHRANG